jgi:hypothetical protein
MQGQAYARALEEARKVLAAAVPRVMESSAGVTWRDGVFEVPFMDLSLEVSYPQGAVTFGGRETDVEVTVVTLHYLAHSAGPLDLQGPVRFQGLQGAVAFAAAFRARVEEPLIQRFGEDGEAFRRAAERLGGNERAGVWQIPFLPHLPLGVRLGEADGMFPADCVIFFPRRAGFAYLAEDLAVAGQLLAGRLLNAAEEGSGPSDATHDHAPWDLPGLLAWARTSESAAQDGGEPGGVAGDGAGV